jgi:four helix bundle protein
MARDHNNLRVFQMSDALALDIYKTTKRFPREERFGLQSQIRRAALSVPSNIVEGCARLTERAYCNYCDIALGSACETRYLIEFSRKLEYFDEATFKMLHEQADAVVRSLSRLVGVLDQRRRDKRLAKWAKKSAALGESSDRRTAPSKRKNR